MSKKFKLRLIGQHDIASQKDVDEWKAMVADQEEQTSAFDLLTLPLSNSRYVPISR
jgi:hypothetical protein